MPEPGRRDGDQPTVNRDDATALGNGHGAFGATGATGNGTGHVAPSSNGHRPDGEEPTADVTNPRASGSAAVPPSPPRRRKWLDDESVIPPPPPPPAGAKRDPTLELPAEERLDFSSAVPVDPWADADPLSPAHLPAVAYPPTRPYEAPHTVAPPPHTVAGPPHTVAPPPHTVAPPPHTVARPPYAGPPVAPTKPPKAPKPPKVRQRPAPPGWRPPPGYVAVPVRRRRKWPWVLLLSVLCCCGVPGYLAQPVWEQWPANATVPDEVVGLSLRTDGASKRAVAALKASTSADHFFAPAFAGIYTDGNGKRVTVFGTTGLHLTPDGDAANELQRAVDRYRLKDIRTVASDQRGTYRRCGVGRDDGQDVVVCSWADHGSVGTGVFTRLSVDDSATLLITLRDNIITRQN